MSSHEGYVSRDRTKTSPKGGTPKTKRGAGIVQDLEYKRYRSSLLGTTKLTEDALCCRLSLRGTGSGCTSIGRLVTSVFRRRQKYCKCQQVRYRLRGENLGFDNGAIQGLVRRLNLGSPIHLGGCQSCQKGVKLTTRGVLRQRFGTRTPYRG